MRLAKTYPNGVYKIKKQTINALDEIVEIMEIKDNEARLGYIDREGKYEWVTSFDKIIQVFCIYEQNLLLLKNISSDTPTGYFDIEVKL